MPRHRSPKAWQQTKKGLTAVREPLMEVETGIEPVCTVLQTVASPLGHSTKSFPIVNDEPQLKYEVGPWSG